MNDMQRTLKAQPGIHELLRKPGTGPIINRSGRYVMGNVKKTGIIISRARRQAGFTLPELLVVMAVFIIVILIASESFKTILSQSSILSKSVESNIQGVLGLEMFQHDLNQAGFGLPWSFYNSVNPSYLEEDSALHGSAYNDNTASPPVPRAFVAGENLAATSGMLAGTDYLALKGTSLALNNSSQRWTYVNYSSVGSSNPHTWPAENLTSSDRVVVIRRAFNDTGYVNELVSKDSSNFYTQLPSTGFSSTSGFAPTAPQEVYYVYGVDGSNLRMPFNRSDYYVKKQATMPGRCADNTGILYKAVVNHNGGTLTEIPLLDCVGDMQVVFGWDTDDDSIVDTWSNANGTTVSGTGTQALVQSSMTDPSLLRSRLKVVKVYILAQNGRKDPTFTNSNNIVVGNASLGEISITKQYTPADLSGNNWTNYRWKVYRIVVNPKNLMLK